MAFLLSYYTIYTKVKENWIRKRSVEILAKLIFFSGVTRAKQTKERCGCDKTGMKVRIDLLEAYFREINYFCDTRKRIVELSDAPCATAKTYISFLFR